MQVDDGVYGHLEFASRGVSKGLGNDIMTMAEKLPDAEAVVSISFSVSYPRGVARDIERRCFSVSSRQEVTEKLSEFSFKERYVSRSIINQFKSLMARADAFFHNRAETRARVIEAKVRSELGSEANKWLAQRGWGKPLFLADMEKGHYERWLAEIERISGKGRRTSLDIRGWRSRDNWFR